MPRCHVENWKSWAKEAIDKTKDERMESKVTRMGRERDSHPGVGKVPTLMHPLGVSTSL